MTRTSVVTVLEPAPGEIDRLLGELEASWKTINRAGFGTYSGFAFLLGFLGAGPFYLTFERER